MLWQPKVSECVAGPHSTRGPGDACQAQVNCLRDQHLDGSHPAPERDPHRGGLPPDQRALGPAAAADLVPDDPAAAPLGAVPRLPAISKGAPQAVAALSSGYSTGFLIIGIVALVCAVVTVLFLGGRTEQEQEIAMIEHGEDAAVA